MASTEIQTWVGFDEPGVKTFDCPAGEVAVVCRAKPNMPGRINEDAVCVLPLGEDLTILLVADGMGGGAHGEIAAALVVNTVIEFVTPLRGQSEHGEVRTAILEGIEEANRKVLEMGVGAGATVALALVSPTDFGTVHAGDSIVLVVGQRGRIKSQSLAHSPVGFALEAGLLDAEQAMFHHERHLVSNIVGMTNMRLEIGPSRKFSRKDTLLIASDGLFDNVTVPEIVDHVRCGPLGEAALAVADLATRRMSNPEPEEPSKPDDMGLILFRPKPTK